MSMIEYIGYLAATCTTLAFAPQALLTWRTKQATGVSLGMYSILIFGIILWLIYGCALHIMPLIIANIVTLGLALFIFVMKLRYN